jgi:phosphoribosylaminoimidazole-succinocarboxamide synthase
MGYVKADFVYEGKAKTIYKVKDQPNLLLLDFKDDLTAFNAEKKGSFQNKGVVNRAIASLIFQYLEQFQVPHHWIKDLGAREMVVIKLEIIPLEVVVRNILAGSTAKKFGIAEGTPLEKPLVEFYFKKDALGDPFVSDDQALFLKAARSQSELEQLKSMAREINGYLKDLFAKCNITLIDFKLEFGRSPDGKILLADEITPDSCRLWDVTTGEKLDKDRFRRDLGQVDESYNQVLERLQKLEIRKRVSS